MTAIYPYTVWVSSRKHEHMKETAGKIEPAKHSGCCGGAHQPAVPDHAHAHHPAATSKALDTVCGMTVHPHKSPHSHKHHGHNYYFCGKGCLTNFVAGPAKYLGDTPREAENVPAGTIF